MLRILWISRFMPLSKSPEAGNKTFYWYFNEIRKDARFQIHLITSGHYNDYAAFEKEIEGIEHDTILWGSPNRTLLTRALNLESKYNPLNRYAGIISNSDILGFKKTIQRLKKNGYTPDVVILEWTQVVLLSSLIKSVYPEAKIVASEHDVTFVGFERRSQYFSGVNGIVWKRKARIEKNAELKALKYCDLIMPHNPDNIDLLLQEGMTTEKLQWLVPYFSNMRNCERQPNSKDVLFFGAMARQENYLSALWFIDNVMPLLEDLPVRFVVLGSNPPEILRARENEHIHITGFVDTIIPYFESSVCLVAPLVLGAGIKVKVLEGLSSGIPVITNKIGIEGIPAKQNLEYIHAEKPEEYAIAVRRALRGELEKIGQSGQDFIVRNYDLESSLNTYKERLLSMK